MVASADKRLRQWSRGVGERVVKRGGRGYVDVWIKVEATSRCCRDVWGGGVMSRCIGLGGGASLQSTVRLSYGVHASPR